MDDEEWIDHLANLMMKHGWMLVGPERSSTGWRAGAHLEPFGRETGAGPTGSGSTAVEAVERVFFQTVGELPERP